MISGHSLLYAFFSCNIYNENLILSKSPYFLASVIIFAYLVDLKFINDN